MSWNMNDVGGVSLIKVKTSRSWDDVHGNRNES
jgi:hypothetical protein